MINKEGYILAIIGIAIAYAAGFIVAGKIESGK